MNNPGTEERICPGAVTPWLTGEPDDHLHVMCAASRSEARVPPRIEDQFEVSEVDDAVAIQIRRR